MRVHVVDDELIVTLPGSFYSVTYYKPENASHLLAKNIADRDDLRIDRGRVFSESLASRQRQGARAQASMRSTSRASMTWSVARLFVSLTC